MPVAESPVLCEDVAVVGTTFYVMEILDEQWIFTNARMPAVDAKMRRGWRVSSHRDARRTN